MDFRKIAVMVLLAAGCAPALRADITAAEVKGAITKNLVHPYLYFSEEDKPALLERIKNDPECRDIMARLHGGSQPSPVHSGRSPGTGRGKEHPVLQLRRVRQLLLQQPGECFHPGLRLPDDRRPEIRPEGVRVRRRGLRSSDLGDPRPRVSHHLQPGLALECSGRPGQFHASIMSPATPPASWRRSTTGSTRGSTSASATVSGARSSKRRSPACAAITNTTGGPSPTAATGAGSAIPGSGFPRLSLLTEDPQLVDVVAESYNRIGKHVRPDRSGRRLAGGMRILVSTARIPRSTSPMP